MSLSTEQFMSFSWALNLFKVTYQTTEVGCYLVGGGVGEGYRLYMTEELYDLNPAECSSRDKDTLKQVRSTSLYLSFS